MSESQPAHTISQTKLFYQLGNMKAMKIVALIKISKLSIIIEEITKQQFNVPYLLRTPLGQLTKQYQIISYVVNESKIHSKIQGEDNKVINLQGQDSYINSRISEKLVELRVTLFPLLEEFYKYLLGHQKTKKAKYDSLTNKIKKQIAKLDTDINQYPQMFFKESCYLNVIIACEIFLICSLVFQEKFRKSKYFLFSMYEKTSAQPQFQEVFGKPNFSSKQYVPQQFDEEEILPVKQQQIIPPQIIKIAQPITCAIDMNRNQLLYNFFRTVFTQHESKKSYFPYFWLMFQSLNCSLVQVVDTISDLKQEYLDQRMKLLQQELDKVLNHNIDYGIIGAYQSQRDKQNIIRCLICLGSKSYDQFESILKNNHEIEEFKLHKIDVNNQKEKSQVEIILEHSAINTSYEDVNVLMILYL